MVGEIGGDEEEKAGAFIAEHVGKPVVAYIAGFQAPAGKTMGHAGAIISGSSGTAAGKKEALQARGIRSATAPPRSPAGGGAAGLMVDSTGCVDAGRRMGRVGRRERPQGRLDDVLADDRGVRRVSDQSSAA
jgi:hypothetical protein